MKKDISIAARAAWAIVAKPITVKKTNSATGMVKKDEDGRFYIPQGTVYPANDNTAVGIVENSVYVDDSDAVISVIMRGHLRKDVIDAVTPISEQAIAALNGITLEDLDASK